MSVRLVGPSGPSDPGSRGLVQAAAEALAPPGRPRLGRLAPVGPGSALVVVGGTPLAPDPRRSPRPGQTPSAEFLRARRLGRLARLTGGSLVLLGVGALPAGGRAGRLMARLADGADLLVLRDDTSSDALRAAGASPPFRVGADPTWTLLDRRGGAPLEPADPAARNGVVLVPAADSGITTRLFHLLTQLGHRPELLAWGPPGPARDSDPVGAPARGSGAGGLVEVRDFLAQVELVLTFRLHAMVAAAAAGTPCVGIGEEPGLKALAARLSQPWVAAAEDAALVAEAVEAARQAGPVARPAVKAEVARAEEGFRLARLVISRGEGDDAETLVGLPLGAKPWA